MGKWLIIFYFIAWRIFISFTERKVHVTFRKHTNTHTYTDTPGRPTYVLCIPQWSFLSSVCVSWTHFQIFINLSSFSTAIISAEQQLFRALNRIAQTTSFLFKIKSLKTLNQIFNSNHKFTSDKNVPQSSSFFFLNRIADMLRFSHDTIPSANRLFFSILTICCQSDFAEISNQISTCSRNGASIIMVGDLKLHGLFD